MAVALTLLLVPGCEGLPSAPSELTTGIVVYEHANFKGTSGHITRDISDLTAISGPCEHYDVNTEETTYDWAGCISSVRVAPGWRATLYRGPDYRDDALDITADVPNLEQVPGNCWKGGLGDCVSSVRVGLQ